MARRHNDPRLDWPLSTGRPGREVWYGFVTVPERPLVLWFRYTLLSTTDGEQEARCWAAITDKEGSLTAFGTHRVPLADVGMLDAPFALEIGGDCGLSHDHCYGSVETDRGTVEWDLSYDPDTVTFTPLRSRGITRLATKLLGTGRHWSVNQSLTIEGEVTVGDYTVEFDEATGHQGHTVGRTPPPRWQWVHCNDFGVDGLAIEALDIGGRLSICLRTPDGPYLLNRVTDVVGPWANETIDSAPGVWEFKASGERAQIQCRLEADTDHWQHVSYRCPDGSLRYNAHCSLTKLLLRSRTWENGWTDWPDAMSRRARAEWVDIAPPVPGEYRPYDSDGGVQ